MDCSCPIRDSGRGHAGEGEQSQSNPRGLMCLLSIRYARKAQNKPKGTNVHVINRLQPFLARFRGKMNGTTNEAVMSFRINKSGKASLLRIGTYPNRLLKNYLRGQEGGV
jgi:hypothetical protein